MTKTLYKLALLIAFMFSLTACERELDKIKPQQSLTEELAFIDKATAQSTLLGVYSSAQILEFYGSMPQAISEFMADNAEFVGSFPTLQELRDFNGISTNGNVAGIWQSHYRVILRANLIIAKVPSVVDPAFTAAERAQFIAEAKFMRALGYFQLTNLFAQPFQVSNGTNLGVPLVLEEFNGIVNFPARNTVNEVHAQIKTDLTEAISSLPVSYSSAIFTRGRATKGAARALLARLHLYREEWQQAADLSKLVLDASTLYTPAADYSFYSSKNTAEDVFTIQNSSIDNARTGTGGWASYHRPAAGAAGGGRGDVTFASSLISTFNEEANDRRFALRSTGMAANSLSAQFTTKWSDAVTNTDNSPVIRTTEVVLNHVEAKAEATGVVSQDLITWMNVLRTRAGLSAWTVDTFASKDDFVAAVLKERRKELAFEGHRRMDLLRRRQNLRPGNPAAAFGADKTILPIPQRELDLNAALKPNPGY